MQALHDFKLSQGARNLSRRQVQVLELVAKRLTLKQVASQLEISESAVNQHIRSLKGLLGVNSLAELAECQRLLAVEDDQGDCRKTAYRNSRLVEGGTLEQQPSSEGSGPVVTFHDPLSYTLGTPWSDSEPSVVPKVLDGSNARFVRAAYIVGIALGMFALVLLGLGVAQGLTQMFASGSVSSPT